jgi:hypothetical protein
MADSGHLHILEWLYSIGVALDFELLGIYAAAGGQIPVLEWVHAIGESWALSGTDNEACVAAAQMGHVHVLRWLAAHDVQVMTPDAAESAARHGRLRVLTWLMGEGLELERIDGLCVSAASGGHLETLEWLYMVGCPCDRDECHAAAEMNQKENEWCHDGHGEVMDWLRRNRPRTRRQIAHARSLAQGGAEDRW